jgi:hypothetical protein
LHPGRSEILSSFLVGKELFDRYIDRIRDLKKILTLPHTQGSFLYLFLVGLVFELRALHLQVRLLQNRHPTAYATSILFWLVLEMGSHELFAKAGLKPVFLISASQVARIIGVSHQCLACSGS